MAKVAGPGPLSSKPINYSGGVSKTTVGVKRKTPSELRGEQLKRINIVELVDESPPPLGSLMNSSEIIRGLKKSDLSKNPRYINTRLDEVYPVRKSSISLRMLSRKENVKENIIEHSSLVKSIYTPSDLSAKSQPKVSCSLEDSHVSIPVKDDGLPQARKTIEKSSESRFLNVKELALRGEKFSGKETVDMDKVLRGLIPHESPTASGLTERSNDFTLGSECSEFHIPGRKTPLDFTLKTVMRVVSSSSVNWFHRLATCSAFDGMAQFISPSSHYAGKDTSCSLDTSAAQPRNPRVLHSWVYPQSPLPPSVISTLTLCAAEGVQMDFLSKRQLTWEDSFRSLYYMLRKNFCNIFYVCTAQFVVMFTADDGSTENKRLYNAFISQSTRGLRSLLREHDICFSMPLCHTKVEQVTTEDLVELSEIERDNFGQTRRLGSTSEVDNCPESLLAFYGTQNVQGLYDFLLNYRFYLTSLNGQDVPILYSPVPFQNAALSTPEVKCKEVRRADHIRAEELLNTKEETSQGSNAGICYSIEIKDAYIPPWIISTVCDLLVGSGTTIFETSFVTEPTTIGLNFGLESVCKKSDPQTTTVEESSKYAFGMPNTIISPHLCSPAYLKGLKYNNDTYTASLSHI